jgi:hypothetical protein
MMRRNARGSREDVWRIIVVQYQDKTEVACLTQVQGYEDAQSA